MKGRKRLFVIYAALILALCAAAFGAYRIYCEYKLISAPAQTAEPAPDEYSSALYTLGEVLAPPSGGIGFSGEFNCVSAERALYRIPTMLAADEKLYAAGSRLYLLSEGKLRSIDIAGGDEYEAEIGTETVSAGTLADGNIWLVSVNDRIRLQIFSPKCEPRLRYELSTENSLFWALVSPYGDKAVFCFENELRILDMKNAELRSIVCAAGRLDKLYFTQTGNIIARDGQGVSELNLADGSITPVVGLEDAFPISGRYAVSEVGFEGTAAVYDILSPSKCVYLPGEAGTSGAMAESGGKLIKTGIINRGEKNLRRLYDLNSGALLQWTYEDTAAGESVTMSADFGWAAYICDGELYLISTEERVLTAFTEHDEYIDSLPQTDCGSIARNVYRLTGVKLYWGADCENIGAAGFSAEAAEDKDCLPTLRTIENFLMQLPQGMLSELTAGVAKELKIYVCGNVRTEPDQGWSVGGFTDMVDGSICIALNINDYHWMQGNLAHEFWHAAEYRMRVLDEARDTDYISAWTELMPEEIRSLYWSTALTEIDSRWMQSSTACGDGTDNPEDIWFVRAYSRSDPGEDRATVFEALNWPAELDTLKRCRHLTEKAEYICNLLRSTYPSCREADTLFWEENLRS